MGQHGKPPRRVARTPLFSEDRPLGRCPDCGKLTFTSRQAAKRAARQQERHGVVVSRVYKCGQWWHWTSQSTAAATAYRDYEAQRGQGRRAS
jgi:hypothetical protein